jgi:tetratricopeptide (TPR) repeat protein
MLGEIMHILKAGIASVALIASAGPALAQRAATTVQQDFDAATALADKGDNAGALAAWQALEKRLPTKNRRSLAIVRVRTGAALYKLDRMDDAVVAVRAGLADLPAADATLAAYRYDAYFQLGQIAESGLDYASAVEAYRTAESIGDTSVTRLAALRGLIASETFVDPERAATDLARAEAILATTATDAKSKAIFATLKSVLMLNLGKYPDARLAAGNAVKLLGGLTSKTDLYDVAARSDYSIAALLEGRLDDARRYMAMTGAGRLPDGIFATGVQMKPPGCSESGLSPDDAAVIEFSIGDDGTVVSSMPIYAAGGGAAGLVFARAARSWSWTPDQVKKLPPFFRYRARVEMRCSTAFARPSIEDYLGSKLDAWLIGKGIAWQPINAASDALALPKQRAQLAASESAKGKDALALVPLLYAIMHNSVVGREETNLLARRALAIADANGVTPIARVTLSRFIWSTDQADRWKQGAFLRTVAPALSDPAFNDPEARSAIRLTLVDALGRKDEKKARQWLQEVGEERALAPNDPLRVGALIRLASLEEANGNAEAARVAFENSGLSARQCALVDSAPKQIRFGGSGDDFPKEALNWGFEGWVLTQFDVTADGLVQNERPIMAYPPFVFSKAGARVIGRSRFEKSYRPDGGLGCGSNTMRTGFRIVL